MIIIIILFFFFVEWTFIIYVYFCFFLILIGMTRLINTMQPDYYHDADQFVREGDGPVYRLTIPCVKLDFTGAYSVIARNVHGEAKAVISLQVYVHGTFCIDSVLA